MSKYSTQGSEKILPPEGIHNARCIRFVELGTVSTDFGDKFKVQMSFELVDESAVFDEEKGEQNHVRHRTFNRSLKARSDMGKAVRALLGDIDEEDEIEMDDILDQPCQVRIKYDNKKNPKYANIVEVIEPGKGKIAKSESETMSLYLNEDFDQEVFDQLPDWMQEAIQETDEYKDLVKDGTIEDDKPKKKGKKDDDDEDDDTPKRKKSRKDDDDEEDDEEDDADEKPRRSARKQRPAKKVGKKKVGAAKKRARR